ncbi:MAG: hypothetical protein AAGD09_09320 [Cyanobacteria bacterium P01_F01_bin.56]
MAGRHRVAWHLEIVASGMILRAPNLSRGVMTAARPIPERSPPALRRAETTTFNKTAGKLPIRETVFP